MIFAGMPASKTKLPAEPLCLVFGDEDFLVRDRASQVYEGWCAEAGGEDHQIIDGTVRNAAEALEAFDDGSYGACVTCEGSIPFARLKALPETPVCLSCQERRE